MKLLNFEMIFSFFNLFYLYYYYDGSDQRIPKNTSGSISESFR
jgi:hypothetical protein